MRKKRTLTTQTEAAPPGVPSVFLRPAEAARSRGIGEASIYRLMKEGRVQGRKFGRTTLVVLASLDQYLMGLPPPTYRQNSSD